MVWWRASLIALFEQYPGLCVYGFMLLSAGMTISKEVKYNTECAKCLYAHLWLM